jgi:acetylornithine deacetylase/succinyl-diaminopimelate desuccinylase-like protein
MDEARLVQLASELISIPSFSGREHRASDWVEARLRAMNCPNVARLKVDDAADTIVGRWEGAQDRDGLLLSLHIDIEEISPEWKADPLQARREGGRLYGAGSHDMKAGAAGLLGALEAFARERQAMRAPLVVAATTDEMRWSRGAHAVLRSSIARGCRYALVGEPSPESTFHDGARGRHLLILPFVPETESRLRSSAKEGERISIRREADTWVVNAYLLPGRSVQDLVRDAGVEPIRVDPRPTPAPPPYRLPPDSRIVRALRSHVPKTSLAQNVSDANHYFAGGLEPVLFGPTGGDTDRGDEYLEIGSLVEVSGIYLAVIRAMTL